jgi:hypothetical protein
LHISISGFKTITNFSLVGPLKAVVPLILLLLLLLLFWITDHNCCNRA